MAVGTRVTDSVTNSPLTDTSNIGTANATATTPNFAIQDNTTNANLSGDGVPYVGPVPGLTYEYYYVGSDNLNVTANISNVFIHTDKGIDAINVSLANGNNVLDGGTGSNFLTGGSGSDTFFIDDRNPTSNIWSTVVGMHSGDSVTVWGITQAGFTLNWVDNAGQPGSTGLTAGFTSTTPGQPTANVTLAGFTSADLSSGKLSVVYGPTPDTPGLPGSSYMMIHAN